MKAVRLYGYGGPEVLKFDIDAPEPAIAPDAVLISVAATSVNPIDWKVRSGARQKDFPLHFPAILGKDVSGIVKTVGADVTTLKPGDLVIALADATYAEYVAVPANLVTLLPEGVDLIEAAALPLVSMTGDQLVRFAAKLEAGQTIIVSGALGSVGRAAVHTAKKLGGKVIAGVRGRQIAEAERLGASSVLALDDDDAIARMGLVDCVADTVGGETAAKLLVKVRPSGKFGYASMLADNAAAANPTVEIKRVFARPDPASLREFADDLRVGGFVLPISQRMPLRDADKAQALVEKGGGGKIVLVV